MSLDKLENKNSLRTDESQMLLSSIKQMNNEKFFLFKKSITDEIKSREKQNIINQLNQNNFAISESDFEIKNYKKNLIMLSVYVKYGTKFNENGFCNHVDVDGFVEDEIKNIFFDVFDIFGTSRTSDWGDDIDIKRIPYYIYSKKQFNYGKYNLFYDNDQDTFCIIEKVDDEITTYSYVDYMYLDEKINDKFVKDGDNKINFNFELRGTPIKMMFKRRMFLSTVEFETNDDFIYIL